MKVLDETTTNWGKTKAVVVKRGGGTWNITVNGVEIECEKNEIPGSSVG